MIYNKFVLYILNILTIFEPNVKVQNGIIIIDIPNIPLAMLLFIITSSKQYALKIAIKTKQLHTKI